MRTDVKVGVAVGLLLVIGVVTYYAIFDRGNQPGPNSPAPQVANKGGTAGQGAPAAKRDGVAKGTDVVLPRFGGLARTPASPALGGGRLSARPAPEPAAPVTPAVAALPTISTPSVPAPSAPEPVVTPSVAARVAAAPEPATPAIHDTAAPTAVAAAPATEPPVTPSMSEPAPVPEPVAPKIRETPILPAGPAVAPKIRETPSTPEGPVTPAIREAPGRPGETTAAGTETTYEVKKGDSGFWAIAEKVYGDGKYWTLIAQANPGVESSSLSPGKKLKIPAKPAPRAAEPSREARGGVVTPAGPAAPAANGQTEYVVKKGDAGFWGIAQTVYGNGKYWAMIAKANPKVSSSGLKIGDKLVIPAKPESATTKPAGTGTAGKETTGTVTPVAGAGQKVYVVDKGDNMGYWGIAKKVYGDGKHSDVIAKANPKVDPTRLHAGQQLIIPELSEEARRATPTTGRAPTTPKAPAAAGAHSTHSTPKAGPKDVEDIGPRPSY
jgi:nucleoid-associated protein YgaU